MKAINLLFFPFAGGNKYSYQQWLSYLPTGINMIVPELPGRGERLDEDLHTNINSMVDEAFIQLSSNISTPYAIYGHSMGGLMAYLFARRACQIGFPPLHLFISGRGGPASVINKKSYLLSQKAFRNQLRKLGGMPDEILNNSILMDILEPIIRSDFKAVETYEHIIGEPINIPLTVMLGKDDTISKEEGMLWQHETTATIDFRWYKGGHFFNYQNKHEIIKLITENLLPLV